MRLELSRNKISTLPINDMSAFIQNNPSFKNTKYHFDFSNNPLTPLPKDLVFSRESQYNFTSNEGEAEKIASGEAKEEKVFRLDTAYFMKQKKSYSEKKWEEEGKVELPLKKGFTKMIVEVEGNLAREIKTLVLKNNPVMKVEFAEKLSRVNHLDGQQCGFASVPRWIESLDSLRRVQLPNNDLTEIPPWFMQMRQLELLFLRNNGGLQSIPNLGENLHKLAMESCDIRSLPHDFFSGKLLYVDLNGNRGE